MYTNSARERISYTFDMATFVEKKSGSKKGNSRRKYFRNFFSIFNFFPPVRFHLIIFITLAGIPTATQFSGISCVTTAFAPITAPSPI